MGNRLIGRCPVCSEEMKVERLHCHHCNTSLEGDFDICRFCKLSNEQRDFVLTFIKNRGNIKEVERELGISYPTVRNRLEAAIRDLGFQVEADKDLEEQRQKRQEILASLSRGEISADEAVKALQKYGD